MKKSIVDETKVLGQNIKRLRQSKGLTQAELGLKVGLTKDTISKFELAKTNITVRQLLLIRRELGVGIDELFLEDPTERYLKLVLSEKNIEALDRLLARVEKSGLFKIIRR